MADARARFCINAGWDDAPHLTEEQKARMLASYMPHERDARSKGIPSMGAGAIYPIPWEEVSIEPIPIPDYWPRAYALDVGWQFTAALWAAWDPSDGRMVVFSEYKAGQKEPHEHARAIKARGEWVPGVVDPAAGGSNQVDGRKLIDIYRAEGLSLSVADNAVEAGIYDVWSGLSDGTLKFFTTLSQTRSEYERYRRVEVGSEKTGQTSKIVKKDDHAMDALRYLRRSGRAVAKVKPVRQVSGAMAGVVGDRLTGY